MGATNVVGAPKEPKRFGHHLNAFGFLRLLLASLVIVAHTPAIVDGDRSRELLTRAFGTISFGELAVDGFFIISGFLISASFLGSKSIGHYLIKRVARIYPAFILACVLCVTVVASLGGATEGTLPSRVVHALGNSLVLRLPGSNFGAFTGTHYPSLNGAAWTIVYEFRCYLLVVLLGVVGLLESAPILALISLVSLIGARALPADLGSVIEHHWRLHTGVWMGDPLLTLRLTGMFLAGAAFRAWQKHIPLRLDLMGLSAVAMTLLLFSSAVAEIGVAVFGSYVIFSAAALGRGTFLERVNNKNDVSYGLYLYAWPIEKLLVAAGLGSSLLVLGGLTWLCALACGALSWFLLERPIMKLARPATGSRSHSPTARGLDRTANGVGV